MSRDSIIVMPSIRPGEVEKFREAWAEQMDRYNTWLLVIWDDPNPVNVTYSEWTPRGALVTDRKAVRSELPLDHPVWDFIETGSPASRNIGFALLARQQYKLKGRIPEIIITMDDDIRPLGDSIGGHFAALQENGAKCWLNTAEDDYPMRGLPYGSRDELPVWVSHGVWQGVPDLDAPNQLVKGAYHPVIEYRRMIVPHRVAFPFCGMNVAFRREALPYMYWMPSASLGYARFDDIWLGLFLQDMARSKKFLIATGYSQVWHERASNVFSNLVKEAPGVQLHEYFWKLFFNYAETFDSNDPLMEKAGQVLAELAEQYRTWQELITSWMTNPNAGAGNPEATPYEGPLL